MTEFEFRSFLLGKGILSERFSKYNWTDLARDMFMITYERFDKTKLKVFSANDLYVQLFEENGELNVNNFSSLLEGACQGYEQWADPFYADNYFSSVKNNKGMYYSEKLNTDDYVSVSYYLEMLRKKGYFVEVKKLAYFSEFYLYVGSLGTHIFTIKKY